MDPPVLLTLPAQVSSNHRRRFSQIKKGAEDYISKEVLEAREDPCIVHFTARWKPWRIYHRGWVHPFSSTWDKYQNKTKWKGIKYDYRTKSQRIRRYAGNILRRFGLLPPLRQNSKFLIRPLLHIIHKNLLNMEPDLNVTA